ncbi:MAG: ROK family protein [Cyclobacteriaceae bacterium]|nr:ROK family protein [Cyclobacteriaceae bacterium]
MDYIGIDLGGTNVRAGLIRGKQMLSNAATRINSKGSVEEVFEQIYSVIDQLDREKVAGIGIGVPSVVNVEKGIVYDVQNIPSWVEVPVKDTLEQKYGLPVAVNNDANCFAMAEYHFGKGQGSRSMVGMIVGTGIAGGIIINGKLFEGANCGAGEFGMINYLDKYFEYYACGQFFDHVYGVKGEDIAEKVKRGDEEAIRIMNELGTHIGKTVEAVLYAYDPEIIVLGGSVSKSYPLYKAALWKALEGFAFSPVVKNLKIEASALEDPGIWGAAALNLE